MKFITISVHESLHFKFKNRCKYYDFTNNAILSKLIEDFVEGKYDHLIGIDKAEGEFNG